MLMSPSLLIGMLWPVTSLSVSQRPIMHFCLCLAASLLFRAKARLPEQGSGLEVCTVLRASQASTTSGFNASDTWLGIRLSRGYATTDASQRLPGRDQPIALPASTWLLECPEPTDTYCVHAVVHRYHSWPTNWDLGRLYFGLSGIA